MSGAPSPRSGRVILEGRTQQVWQLDDGAVVTASGRRVDEASAQWLPPFEPGSIIAVALNFSDHAAELSLEEPEQPALFPKFRNALVGHRGNIVRPRGVEYMHYETELAVVIGREARRVPRAEALDVVKGYTVANDLVVRDFVINHFRPPIKPKNFDTFLPMGPFLVDKSAVPDPQALEIRTVVNGEERQRGTTAHMMRSVAELIEYITEFMTLRENDVLLTGTPKGISHLRPGDVVSCQVEGVGELVNQVVAEEDLLG